MADREKILKGLEYCSKTVGKACPWECPYRVECMMQDDGLHMYSVMYDALELLREQPEQKHGHWISYGCGFYRCSVCEDAKNMNFVPNYCSTCGAKMDEEVKQDGS